MNVNGGSTRPAHSPHAQGEELRVHLAAPEALYGVLSVLHTRRVGIGHVRFDGRLLRIGVCKPGPHLVPQVARRVDVVNVELIKTRWIRAQRLIV